MSLFRQLTPVILVPDRPPRRLCPVSFVTAALSPLPFLLFRQQQGFQVANHNVYHHIQNNGRQWVALGDPSFSA